MKKALFSLVLILGLAGLSEAKDARVYGVPSAPDGTRLQSSEYGGVTYATSVFSSQMSTGCIVCEGAFMGVIFSTGAAAAYDFVDVYDATSTDKATTGTLMTRLYNVNGSTTSGIAVGGFSGPRYPIHFYNGVLVKPSVATYNVITTLFWALPREP